MVAELGHVEMSIPDIPPSPTTIFVLRGAPLTSQCREVDGTLSRRSSISQHSTRTPSSVIRKAVIRDFCEIAPSSSVKSNVRTSDQWDEGDVSEGAGLMFRTA